MHRDADHPYYHPAMELLTLLPCAPHSARVTTLIQDLGLGDTRNAHRLDALVRELEESGYRIRESLHPQRGRTLRIAPESWALARSAGEAYMRRVYQSREAAA